MHPRRIAEDALKNARYYFFFRRYAAIPIAISAAPKMYRSFVPMPPVSGSPLMPLMPDELVMETSEKFIVAWPVLDVGSVILLLSATASFAEEVTLPALSTVNVRSSGFV